MLKRITNNKTKIIVCFAATFILCWMFPYTGDDWAWGSSIGLERLETLFEGYSGRYLGNFIVLALTRSNFLKSFTMAVTITAIAICLEKIAGSTRAFSITILFLLLTPRLVFRQAIVWTAGFSNYCTSVALILIFLLYAIRNPEEKDKKHKTALVAGFMVLGLANTLIVEHVTIYSLLFAAGLTVYAFFRDKEHLLQYFTYFVGTAAGTSIMFSNSVYHNIAEGSDGYRSMAASQTLLDRLKENYFECIYYDGFYNNTFLNIALLMVAIILFKKCLAEKRYSKSQAKISAVALGLFTAFVAYSVFMRLTFSAADIPAQVHIINGIVAFLGLVSLLAFSLVAGSVFGDTRRVLLISISILMVIAPLFLVTPIGSRCFFVSYVLFIALLCVLAEHANIAELVGHTDSKILLVIAMTIYITYLSIFAIISTTNNSRLNNIRKAVEAGKSEAIFTELPFNTMLWTSTPKEGIWQDRYKLFYGLPEDLHIEIKRRK